jgi:quinol monooxygenase YgiN
MIQHTVVFRLKHQPGSLEEQAFLESADVLTTIPGVARFEKYRQVSKKNPFTFGFSMFFADQGAYDAYNTHPDHVAFVQQKWIPQVAEFMEIDYVTLA